MSIYTYCNMSYSHLIIDDNICLYVVNLRCLSLIFPSMCIMIASLLINLRYARLVSSDLKI